jgi:hypothetical protein
MLDWGMVHKIQKAKEYASEPERIHFRELTVDFEGRNNGHQVTFHDGEWECDCDYRKHHETCSHIMALQRVLGIMAPDDTLQAAQV